MTRRHRFQWMIILASILCIVPAKGNEPAKKLSFNRDIRPILSDRCYACHGFDEKKREAMLSLDTFEGATAVRDSGVAIEPGKPDSSLVIERVLSNDPELKMPPPSSNKHPLSSDEVNLLRRWIAEGAEYQKHWSFLPIASVTPPRESASQPIDRFVLSSLREQGAAGFSDRATKERVLRRVTFDLTGLPPTIAELDAYLADESPQAFERVVDRLLSSPSYGERMASEWLDAARFADTHGYQMDRERRVWSYRDWVIRSFNDNLPYSDFVKWQLAGDLLPHPTKDQRLATAFNRLHNQNEEGGIVEEEFRVAYVVDRVTTFGTVFLGLTLECSRCHDHKYDPITAKEFYSLFAFFQNISEPGQTSYFTPDMPTPAMLLSSDKQDAEIVQLDQEIAAKEIVLSKITDDQAFNDWLTKRPSAPEIPGKVAEFKFETIAGNKLVNEVDAKRAGNCVEGPELVEGPAGHGKAGKSSGDNGFDFPGLGHFHRAQPFSFSLWIKQPEWSKRAVVLHHSKAPADAASRGYDLLLEEGHVSFGLYYMWPGSAIKIRTKERIAANQWTHVVGTYDGSSKASGMALFLNGEKSEVEVIRDNLTKDITYGDEPNLAIGYRFRDNGFKDGAVDGFALFDRKLTPLEAAHLADRHDFIEALESQNLSTEQREKLHEYFLATVSGAWKKSEHELSELRDKKRRLLAPIPEIMVMEELPSPKPAHLLVRGNYDQPSDEVTADTPKALPPLSADTPRNRLGLADWLLSPDNPLMARVTVNRYWQMLFGKGIVETSDNFGMQGSPPSHPELLDWLAKDFVEHGWDVKRLLKQIVMSDTYQQDSKASDWGREHDADNRWLSHAPSRILTAEMMRDQSLALSGLLTVKIGGPSVKPYQPDGLWSIAMGNPNYAQSHGPDLYRRSLYTYWKKTVPPPSMMTLDAADRSYCTVRRQSTNTPLQSLVLLNDPQFVEAARAMAERSLKEGGKTTQERLEWLFRCGTSRQPGEKELATLLATFEEQQKLFADNPESAKQLLKVGERGVDEKLDATELAALTAVTQMILNLDEAVRRR
ncbi:DUF1553 domain-containing protein [bacterium]|nr:DUF1553 domain-containing protein [bacterium]